jgi:hypothetical protein
MCLASPRLANRIKGAKHMTMGVSGYKTKKELKAAIGKPLNYVETSMFGAEYKTDGSFCVVGPCAHTKRTWFATVTMKEGLIVKVS